MKNLFFFVIIVASALVAQTTVTAPSATAYQVTLAWTLAADCTSTQPCVVIPYRQVGSSCPSTVA